MNCEKCNKEHDGKYASGRYCSSKCAHSRTITAEWKLRISSKLRKNFLKKCERPDCFNETYLRFCSVSCAGKITHNKPKYLKKISEINKTRCLDINERIRLREIGRKGGFGKKGSTARGVYYSSTLEKKCFEFLEERRIVFEPHKQIPLSAKVSDVYLTNNNIWIELDGINREKRKKWLGQDYFYWLDKIKIYKQNSLKFKVFLTFDDFKGFIEAL